MAEARTIGDRPVWRRFLPIILIPSGMLYCQLFEVFFGGRAWNPASDLYWAIATLSPWAAAAILFEHLARPQDNRARLIGRAILLCAAAYLVSGLAARAIGGDNFHAFYSRLPLAAAGLLIATFYPIAPRRDADVAAGEEGIPPVMPAEIMFASAAGNYVELHYGGRSTVWRQTMRNAERILAAEGFVRIHRSFLVPRHGIEAVRNGRKGPVAVALRDGRRLPVSHSYAANLRVQ
jgi:hypothetical protein